MSMKPNVVLEQVKDTAADVLGVPAASLTGASSPESVESWDSVQHLSLVMALEQRFNVSFDPDEIEKMRSIQSMADELSRKLAP